MKYIIEIENEPFERNGDTFFSRGMDKLYKAKGFKSLVFDQDGLDKLTPYIEPDRKAVEDEVWGFAKEVRLEEFIDEEGRLHGYISGFNSYSEAKEKYEAWRKQKDKIRVGDEVIYNSRTKAIVLKPETKERYGIILTTSELATISVSHDDLEKTGRHFDEIEELLKKMREEE